MAAQTNLADDLEELVSASRKKPVNFAVCLGKRPENTAFLLHRRKEPKMLLKLAKKAEGVTASKNAFGFVQTQGTRMTLTCYDTPASGIARKLRTFLKSRAMSMKVVLVDLQGGLLEDDGEPEEGETPASPAQTPAPDPLAAEWTSAMGKAAPVIAGFTQSGHPKAQGVQDAWNRARSQAEAGDYAAALALLEKLLPLLEAAPPTPPTPPEDQTETIKTLFASLKEDVAALKGTLAHETLMRKLGEAAALTKAGDQEAALKLLVNCTDVIAKLTSAQRSKEAAASIPQGIVGQRVKAIEAEMLRWQTARLRSLEGVGELVSLLMREDDIDLLAIAGKVNRLQKNLPDALEDALAQMAKAATAGDAQAEKDAHETAHKLLTETAHWLKANSKELQLCEANPFGIPVEILAPLSQSLSAISQGLKRL